MADSLSSSTISTLHSDIIQAHILTRLDGSSLAAAACVSSQFRRLSSDEKLWKDICVAAWPSVDHPLVGIAVSDFPLGHRSFFSDAFPLLDHRSPRCDFSPSSPSPQLISAVDIFFQNRPIFTRVHRSETESSWFLSSPFRVELLDPKESVSTPLRRACSDEDWLNCLEENLSVSWIVFDSKSNRAASISSRNPVSVQRRWLTGEIELRYSTIMSADDRPGSLSEFVQCGVVVNCAVKGGGEVELREVSMQIEDMEGKHLNGKNSREILQAAMESGERKKGKKEEAKEKYEEFQKTKRQRTQKKQKREKAVDTFLILAGIAIFIGLCSFVLFR